MSTPKRVNAPTDPNEIFGAAPTPETYAFAYGFTTQAGEDVFVTKDGLRFEDAFKFGFLAPTGFLTPETHVKLQAAAPGELVTSTVTGDIFTRMDDPTLGAILAKLSASNARHDRYVKA